MNLEAIQHNEAKSDKEKANYEAPAIVYESVISTRAGTPFFAPPEGNDVDPADLFGDS